MAETITNITQPAPIFEEGAKKYLAELTDRRMSVERLTPQNLRQV